MLTIITTAAKQNNHLQTKQTDRDDLSLGSEDSLSGTDELESQSTINKIPIYSYPKLHRLMDRITSERERLGSKYSLIIHYLKFLAHLNIVLIVILWTCYSTLKMD